MAKKKVMADSSLFWTVDGVPVLERVCKALWRAEQEQSDFVKGQGELLAGVGQRQHWSAQSCLWACWRTSGRNRGSDSHSPDCSSL